MSFKKGRIVETFLYQVACADPQCEATAHLVRGGYYQYDWFKAYCEGFGWKVCVKEGEKKGWAWYCPECAENHKGLKEEQG